MTKRVEVLRNVLILTTLAGLVLFSWLLGHILRYSIPAIWHPPIPEKNLPIEYGNEFEFAGIRRLAELPEMALGNALAQTLSREAQVFLPEQCLGSTYYTSLPAKCQTADGRLVQAGGIKANIIILPQGK